MSEGYPCRAELKNLHAAYHSSEPATCRRFGARPDMSYQAELAIVQRFAICRSLHKHTGTQRPLFGMCGKRAGCGGSIWTHSDGLTWLRLDEGSRLDLAPPRAAAGSPAAARERGESVQAGRVVLSEIHARRRLPGVAGAAGKSGGAST